MNYSKVAIITITFNLINANRKDFFKECIESVAMQDYPNYEHIIIDGASTDGTIDLIKEYADKGVIRYISEPDTGIYNAFNKGIKNTDADIIAFLNSDDFYTRKDAISLAVKSLEENKADFTSATFDIIDSNKNIVQQPTLYYEKFPLAMPFGHPTMFGRRDIFIDLNGFNEDYKITADFDFVIRATLKGYTPCKIDTSFVAFRLGGISSSASFDKLLWEENIKTLVTGCGFTPKKATEYHKKRYIPKKVLEKLLENISPAINKEKIYRDHKGEYLKYLRRQLFTFRFSKKRKIIKLLGITFFNNDPKRL